MWEYHKAGLVQWKVAGWLSGGLLLGSALGAELALSLPLEWLQRGYACFLLYVAASNLGVFRIGRAPHLETESVTRREGPFHVWLLVGFAAGIVAGLFGKGGGVIIVPVLMGLFAYRAKEATGTSLAALQLPVGLPGVVLYARSGVLDARLAGLVALGLLAGTFFGTRIAIGLKPSLFKKLFGLFLLSMSVFLFLH